MTARALAIGLVALLSGGGAWRLRNLPKERLPPADRHESSIRRRLLETPTLPCGRRFSISCPFALNELRCSTWIRCRVPARQKLRGLDGFVLAGHTTIVVIRQGATLRQAEFGDAVDRLALASLVWHEMAHANGLDERAALAQERGLWQRFISAGLVDSGVGLTYIARLQEVSARVKSQSKDSGPTNKTWVAD